MLILLALLVVFLFFGLGFAVAHVLWVAAVILLALWLVGFAIGRGENAVARRFYYW
jgi:hypothetical protein